MLVSDTGSTSTSYVDETVDDDTTYHYAVAALNAAGAGPQSTQQHRHPGRAAGDEPSDPGTRRTTDRGAAASGRREPDHCRSTTTPIVTFASNLGKPNANNTPANTLTSAEVRFQQSFTTGPGGSGFLLDSFSFRAWNGNDFLIVSLSDGLSQRNGSQRTGRETGGAGPGGGTL